MKSRLTPNNQIIVDTEIALKLLKDKYGEFFVIPVQMDFFLIWKMCRIYKNNMLDFAEKLFISQNYWNI